MFKVIKICLSIASLGAFVWFGFTVRLGDRTFFGHVRSIAQSKESQELVKGTKDTVAGLFEPGAKGSGAGAQGEGRRAGPGESAGGPAVRGAPGEPHADKTSKPVGPSASNAPPQEEITAADREGMRKLLESRGSKTR